MVVITQGYWNMQETAEKEVCNYAIDTAIGAFWDQEALLGFPVERAGSWVNAEVFRMKLKGGKTYFVVIESVVHKLPPRIFEGLGAFMLQGIFQIKTPVIEKLWVNQ